MKRCDYVKAKGYPVLEKGKKEITFVLPSWLPKGIYKISKIRIVPFGILVKTDRIPRWINSNWFSTV